MAPRKERLAAIIRANGHLVLDGTETTQDLRDALINLYTWHQIGQCHRPEFGIPIGELIPSISAIMPKRMNRKPVHTVDLRGLSL